MYFDLAPKEKLEDLYDFRELYQELASLLKVPVQRNPLIVVKGVRRAGKTSLIKTTLNELGLPYLYIDGRKFADMPVIKKKDLLKELERELTDMIDRHKKWWEPLREVLESVRWIKVSDKFPFVHFEWRRPVRDMDIPDIIFAFQVLSRRIEKRVVLVLDEAQHFKRLADYKLQNILAHIFDHVHEIQMVVSGSQVGLLYDFLEVEDPKAPLFGRGTADIIVSRLSRDLATDFLRKGSRQVGIKNQRAIELAVNELDGVIGWLTLFGRELVMGGSAEDALARTIEKGAKLEAQELENFLKTKPQARARYTRILKAAVRWKGARWVTLKETVETWEKKKINDANFNNLLQNLLKADFLNKKGDIYQVPDDSMLIRAIGRLP